MVKPTHRIRRQQGYGRNKNPEISVHDCKGAEPALLAVVSVPVGFRGTTWTTAMIATLLLQPCLFFSGAHIPLFALAALALGQGPHWAQRRGVLGPPERLCGSLSVSDAPPLSLCPGPWQTPFCSFSFRISCETVGLFFSTPAFDLSHSDPPAS